MTLDWMIEKYMMKIVDTPDGEKVAFRTPKKEAAKAQKFVMDNKPQIIARIKEQIEQKRQEKLAKEQERQNIIEGRTPIKVSFYDGEYLSAYTVYGEAASLLGQLGLGREVMGWGFSVPDALVEALGTEFTYPQAKEFARPALEARQAKQAKAEADRQAKFDEAKRTGKPVLLHEFADECDDPKEECNTDIVTVYAMPDGSTQTKRVHTW